MSDAGEPEAEVPASLGSGVFANDIEVFRDVDDTMLDFVWVDPRRRERALVVERLVVSPSCILKLKHELEAVG